MRDTVTRPWKALGVALRGVRTEGAMAPEIPLEGQRPAAYVFESNVSQKAFRQAQGRVGKGSERRPRQRSSARNAALLSRAAAMQPG